MGSEKDLKTGWNRAALNALPTDATLVSALVKLFKDDPASQKFLLKDTQHLSRKTAIKPRSQIGLSDQLSVIGNASQLLGAHWGFHRSDFWELALDNVFCTAVRTAPTISEAMDTLGRFGHLWSPAIYYECFHDQGFKTLTVDIIDFGASDDLIHQGLETLKELSLIGAFRLLNDTLHDRWTGAYMQFDTPAPAQSIIHQIFKEKLDLSAPRTGLKVPEKVFSRSCHLADPAKNRKANLFLQNMLSPTEEDRSLESIIFAYINATQFYRPTIGEIAKYLGMSVRTLNRRLEISGRSFREILEQSLRERSEFLIRQGQLSRGEIADRLGYKDQASFSRALRRWQAE